MTGLKRPDWAPKDDPRLKGHETDYSSSRGGWFPAPAKPVAGAPKKEEEK